MIPDKSGNGIARCMELALKDAGLTGEEIGYINAHGTATKRGDLAEALAIKEVFKRNVAVSSTKSSIGHMLGAAGGIEAIFSILAITKAVLPPTLN